MDLNKDLLKRLIADIEQNPNEFDMAHIFNPLDDNGWDPYHDSEWDFIALNKEFPCGATACQIGRISYLEREDTGDAR